MSFCLSAFSMAARLPQAGTCCGCQPEGLKFLQLAQPLLKLRKQKGEGAAVNCGRAGGRTCQGWLPHCSPLLCFPSAAPMPHDWLETEGNKRLPERLRFKLHWCGRPG